jgi:hypothetical protein
MAAMKTSALALFTVAVLHMGCYTKLNTPVAEIPSLKTLKEVMDNQGPTADPHWGKIGATSLSDAELEALAIVGERIQATSLKIKDFSKGKDFDDLAMKLNGHAKDLQTAAKAKDAAAAGKALGDMKATCKACHDLYK